MARTKPDQPLMSSVFDRLIDERPDLSTEPPRHQHQVLEDLCRSVRRDLENLLNTRWRAEGWPPELTELKQSLVGYGIPDISGEDLGSPARRQRFLRQVEEMIRLFEPRFQRVKVLEVENADAIDRTLRFRVDAVLHAFPVPHPIAFDSSLEPASRTFRVEDSA